MLSRYLELAMSSPGILLHLPLPRVVQSPGTIDVGDVEHTILRSFINSALPLKDQVLFFHLLLRVITYYLIDLGIRVESLLVSVKFRQELEHDAFPHLAVISVLLVVHDGDEIEGGLVLRNLVSQAKNVDMRRDEGGECSYGIFFGSLSE